MLSVSHFVILSWQRFSLTSNQNVMRFNELLTCALCFYCSQRRLSALTSSPSISEWTNLSIFLTALLSISSRCDFTQCFFFILLRRLERMWCHEFYELTQMAAEDEAWVSLSFTIYNKICLYINLAVSWSHPGRHFPFNSAAQTPLNFKVYQPFLVIPLWFQTN